MSIQRRPDGRWRARIYVDGREYARHFDRKTDAQRWHTEQLAAKQRGQFVDPSASTTVTQYAYQWAAMRPYRPSTARNVEILIRCHIEPTSIGRRRLVALRPSEVQAWASDRAGHMSPLRLRNLVGLLRTMMKDAVLDRLIASNPVGRVSLPSTERERIEPLIPEQVHAIIEALPERNRAMVLLMATSGVRIGELLAVRVQDVDFLRRTLRVEWQFVPGSPVRTQPKTPKSRRTIPLPTVTLDALAAHIKTFGVGDDGTLFVTYQGQHYKHDYFQRLFKQATKTAGITGRVTPHACRHFYASRLLHAEEPITTVSDRLGHASAATTLSIYAHMVRRDDDATRRIMDGIFARSLGLATDQDRATSP